MVASVSDDDRTRRRLGDDTKGRIADLASGWSVEKDTAPAPEAPAPANAPRRKHKTLPPPPPGSPERQALEDAILDSNTPVPVAAPPKAFAKSGPTETGTVARSGVIGTTGPVELPSGPVPKVDPRATGSGPTAARLESEAKFFGMVVKPGSSTGTNTAIPAQGTPTGPIAKPGSSTGNHSAIPASAKAALSERAHNRTQPPPIPPPKKPLPLRPDATETSPPPPPGPMPRAKRADVVGEIEAEPTITQDEPGAMPHLAVPLGEFDGGPGTVLEPDKLRIAYEQSTLKRDAASALLGIAEAPQTQVRPPPTSVLLEETAHNLLRGDPTESPSTTKFERGDPTALGSSDPTVASLPTASTGTLRSGAALRRMRGPGGDLRYVLTVLMGVRRARRELETLDKKQDLRMQSRRRHLITLGRVAATLDNLDHPALGPARDQLAAVEDERSRHAGSVTAADAELARVHRDREAKTKQHVGEVAALDTELAEITRKLEPLEKEHTAISRRVGELRDALRDIDGKIAATEASQHAVGKKGRSDLDQIHAELATLKADRIAVKRDEPKIAGELDAIAPRMAALEARRVEAKKRCAEIARIEADEGHRTEELLAAIGAKRKVVDRAAADAETLRDKILFDLAERLYVDRPSDLTAELAPIDVIDVDLGTGERRAMELREILSSIDKAKLARGIALATLILAIVGGITAYILYLAL
jgi:hypothetical protein